MAKGLFTQGMCVLLSTPIGVEQLRSTLRRFKFERELASEEDSQTLVYRFRPEAGGHLLVTLSPNPWPDDLGDPESSPDRFIAWSLGQYAPLAFPGCLRRAGEQSWSWDEGGEAVKTHQCHVRFLISYVLDSGGETDDADDNDGSEAITPPVNWNDIVSGMTDADDANDDGDDDDDDDDALLPDDYDPIAEMDFMMRAVEAVMGLPESLCYFNPGGEVIRDRDGLREGLNFAWSHELPPLDMWTNVRIFKADPAWSLMDTVGNGQFDVPDVEAVFDTGRYDPGDVERLLRSTTFYLVSGGGEIGDGDTVDGPGDQVWKAIECVDGLSDPPRETIRWVPQDDTSAPESLLDPGVDPESQFDEDDLDDDFDEDAIDPMI